MTDFYPSFFLFLASTYLHEVSHIMNKNEPHRSSIFEVIDYEWGSYLKA